MTEKKKRGYSREFTPVGQGDAYKLDKIPGDLWLQFRARCAGMGVSVRSRLLTLITRDLRPRRK
jgi:hypothetical protein